MKISVIYVVMLICFGFSGHVYSASIEEARSQGLEFGSSFDGTASGTISEYNKVNTQA